MQHVESLPYKLRHRARHVLKPGERVVWVAQPVPRCFTPDARGLFLFGIPWTAVSCTAVAIIWNFQAPDLSFGSTDWFGFLVTPFVLVGLVLLSAPLYARYWALGAAFMITDRRALIFEGGFLKRTRDFPPRRLRRLSRIDRPNGLGDIVFEKRTIVQSDGGKVVKITGFKNIPDAAAVERLLEQLADTDADAGGPAR
ncbi:MAG: PH domain-containing protein [Phycisphaerales bacterium]|nr:PH domain-containing protein [Phycisphaerales bacterium]